MACETLQWRHMAPTAPDTLCTFDRSTNNHLTFISTPRRMLGCYPYFNDDPFIMTRTPHLYFIGNQPRFESTLLTHKGGQKTRVVLLPRFSESGQVVLVNPKNLDIKVVSIGTGWEESR
jgi:DNA polymerase delta subunit 2